MSEKYIKRIFILIDLGLYDENDMLCEIYSYLTEDLNDIYLYYILPDSRFPSVNKVVSKKNIDLPCYYDTAKEDIFIPYISKYFTESAKRFNISNELFITILKAYIKHKLNL